MKYTKSKSIKRARLATPNLERGKGKLITQEELAARINVILEENKVATTVSRDQITSLENSGPRAKNLDLVTGLALATVLDSTMSDFVSEKILTLGAFETKMVQFDSTQTMLKYFQNIQKGGRIVVSSRFPDLIHTTNTRHSQGIDKEDKKIHQALYKQFDGNSEKNTELYSLGALLDFAFSPFAPYSLAEKIAMLDEMHSFFSNYLEQMLHFFTSDAIRDFASFQISLRRSMILWGTPLADQYVEMRSPFIANKLAAMLEQEQPGRLNRDDSLLLIEVLADVLDERHEDPVDDQIVAFYNHDKLPEHVKAWMKPSLMHLLPEEE